MTKLILLCGIVLLIAIIFIAVITVTFILFIEHLAKDEKDKERILNDVMEAISKSPNLF